MTKTELLKQIIAKDEVLQNISSRLGLDEIKHPVDFLKVLIDSDIREGLTKGFATETETSEFFDRWEDEICWWFDREVGSINMVIEEAVEKIGAYEVMKKTEEAKRFYTLLFVQDKIIVDVLDRIEDELS